jgi:hypothetical protein
MDSTIHSHIIGIHIQERIGEGDAARLAREASAAREPRHARRRLWRRAAKPRPNVAVRRTV